MVRLKVASAFEVRRSIIFQFHYGTIKSFIEFCSIVSNIHFNSTMVRLKAVWMGFLARRKLHFNSTMVRLKVSHGIMCERLSCNFNSTMVRLKEGSAVTVGVTTIFQFHYGTIKSGISRENEFHDVAFQFHYGTIKSQHVTPSWTSITIFQFHYGTIKRLIGIRRLQAH